MADRTVTIRAVLLDQLSSPLARARAGLVGVRDELEKIGRGVAPLTGQLSQLIAAFVSVQTARAALAAAEEEVNAQQRLLSALQGRVRAQQEIIRTAGEIQAATRLADERLVNTAATMRAIGVQADLIPRSLRVAADVAEQLALPLETVGRDIAAVVAGAGEARGISRFIAGLRELREAGASTEEILSFLEQRFRGAAEAAAQTTFGRLTQEQNKLSDALESVGKVLAELWLPLFAAGRAQVERLANAMQSPEFAAFTRVVKENADAILRWATAIASVIAGLLAAKAAAFVFSAAVGLMQAAVATLNIALIAVTTTFGVVATAVTSIVTATAAIGGAILSIGSIVGAVQAGFAALAASVVSIGPLLLSLAAGAAAIAAAVLLVRRNWDGIAESVRRVTGATADAGESFRGLRSSLSDIARFIGSFAGDISGIFREAAQGRLTIDDLFEFVKARVRELGILIRSRLVAEIENVIDIAGERISALRDAFAAEIKGSVVELFTFDPTEPVERQIAVLQGRIQRFQDGIEKNRARLVAASPEDRQEIEEMLAGLEQAITQDVNRIAALRGEILKLNQESRAGQVSEALARAGGVASDELKARIEERLKLSDEGAKKIEEIELKLEERLAAAREEGSTKLIAGLEAQTAAERERIEALVQTVAGAEDALAGVEIDLSAALVDIDEDRIRELFQSVSQEGREEVGAAIAAELERGFREGELSARRFFELRKALATESIEVEAAAANAVAEERRAALDDAREQFTTAAELRDLLQEQLAILTEQGASALQRESLTREILEATKDESDALGRVAENSAAAAEAEERRNQIAIRRVRAEQELEAVRTSIAEALVQDAERARQELEDKKAEIQRLFQDGLLGGQEANLQDAEVLAAFRERLNEIRAQLLALAPAGETAAAGIDQATAALNRLANDANAQVPAVRTRLDEIRAAQERLVEESNRSGASFGDFMRGVRLGAEEVAVGFSNLATAGIDLGRQLVTNLARGLSDVFIAGRKSFREFLGEFLLGIAEMIAQLVIYRAVATALGFFFPTQVPQTGGAGAGFARKNLGGKIASQGEGPRYFDRGGQVPGLRVHRDVIPAMLTPGEWVLNESAVAYYGDRFMSALNRRLIPRELLAALNIQLPSMVPHEVKRRFATGGAATSSAASFGAPSGGLQLLPAVVMSEDQFRRQLAAGTGSLKQWLSENGYQPQGFGRA